MSWEEGQIKLRYPVFILFESETTLHVWHHSIFYNSFHKFKYTFSNLPWYLNKTELLGMSWWWNRWIGSQSKTHMSVQHRLRANEWIHPITMCCCQWNQTIIFLTTWNFSHKNQVNLDLVTQDLGGRKTWLLSPQKLNLAT